MEKVYISWSIENWITVVLMVALGYFLVSLVTSLVRKRLGGGGLPAQVSPGQALTGSMGAGSLTAIVGQSLASGG